MNIRYEYRARKLVRLGILPAATVVDPLQRRERARRLRAGLQPGCARRGWWLCELLFRTLHELDARHRRALRRMRWRAVTPFANVNGRGSVVTFTLRAFSSATAASTLSGRNPM
jgi:hypothetical protein